MKVNILETGSAGNCVLATFSDERKVIFDFGKNAWEMCVKLNVDLRKIDDVLVTHEHLDHCADFGKVQFINFPKTLKVLTFPVVHNVPNRGFVVLNERTKEGFIYATDYSVMPPESLDKIKAFVSFKDWNWFAMLELSYCKFIYNKLDAKDTFGLINHCSDETFYQYASAILEVNPAVNILTLHASARQGQYIEGEEKTGDVCAPDFIREQLWRRYGQKGLSVRFGFASGLCGTFNYIEKK
jgi:hypothetical protein